jgi:hypothetical protein
MSMTSAEAHRAADRRYRLSRKGRDRRAAQSRRWRSRNRAKAAARVGLLKAHGARLDARRSDPARIPPVASLDETIQLRKRELWKAATLAEAAGDEDAAAALRFEAHLLKPAPRPDSSAPIVAAGEMAEDLAALGDAFGFAIAPHGPGGE